VKVPADTVTAPGPNVAVAGTVRLPEITSTVPSPAIDPSAPSAIEPVLVRRRVDSASANVPSVPCPPSAWSSRVPDASSTVPSLSNGTASVVWRCDALVSVPWLAIVPVPNTCVSLTMRKVPALTIDEGASSWTSVLTGPQVPVAPSSTRSTWPPVIVIRFWLPESPIVSFPPDATDVVALPDSAPP
jgi:hypothetical protein